MLKDGGARQKQVKDLSLEMPLLIRSHLYHHGTAAPWGNRCWLKRSASKQLSTFQAQANNLNYTRKQPKPQTFHGKFPLRNTTKQAEKRDIFCYFSGKSYIKCRTQSTHRLGLKENFPLTEREENAVSALSPRWLRPADSKGIAFLHVITVCTCTGKYRLSLPAGASGTLFPFHSWFLPFPQSEFRFVWQRKGFFFKHKTLLMLRLVLKNFSKLREFKTHLELSQ